MKKRTFLKTIGTVFSAATVVGTTGFWSMTARATDAKKKEGGTVKKRIAFVYFSKTGHTKSVAEAVQAMTGADIYEVETVEPYPEAYRPTTEVVKDEIEKGIVREIKPLVVNLSKYDAVAFGTPTWWHHVAVPLQTWIKAQDFKGKFVVTCNTHGGGGLMHTREDFEALFKDSGATLGTHLTVYGGVGKSDGKVREWLENNDLL